MRRYLPFFLLPVVLSACNKAVPFSLRDEVSRSGASVHARGPASAGEMTAHNERRWGWGGAGVQRVTLDLSKGSGVLRLSCFGPHDFRVRVSDSEPLLETKPLPAGWNDLEVDLSRALFQRSVTLELLDCNGAPCGWGDVTFSSKDAHAPKTNLLFILVDTMRADAVSAYGGRNPTPVMDAIGKRGAVFERTIAQAPWTLPSTVSVLSGVWPSISPGWGTPAQGPNPNVTTLAEIMRSSGYMTAAFIANPLIKDELGFGRGFDTYWNSPPENNVLTTADVPVKAAAGWIGTHQTMPWFAYLHLMDPHDPYYPLSKRATAAPGTIGNPDGAFMGTEPMPDANKIREWRSLYDEEVRWVDKQIGVLLDSMPQDVRDNTLVVITADHGEEFMEHGYLKHGPNLFDVALHVPLIVAGPRVKAATRVRELSRLVDVVPTIADLLHLQVPRLVERRWSGVSLAAALTSGAAIPHLDAISETFGFGPLRWCIDDGSKKAFFFNKGHKLPDEYPALPFPLQWIESHYPVEAVYRTAPAAAMDSVIVDEQALRWGRAEANAYVNGKVGGTWISIRGNGSGGRLRGTVTSTGSGARLVPFFWSPSDRIDHERDGFHIDIANDGLTRLAVILGGSREDVVRVSNVSPAIAVSRQRPSPDAIGIYCWDEADPQAIRATAAARGELIAQLRALGYIQ